ncbi:MAG: hypothetical protein AcusKO_24680 [Acuticoccus sp.]
MSDPADGHRETGTVAAKATEPRFLDVGCSGGGSLAWGHAQFDIEGVGIDISEDKVRATLQKGFRAEVADATQLRFDDSHFKFALMFDILEHLPDAKTAQRCVQEAFRVSSDFIIVRGPNFDHENELRNNDLKRYYADWSGHTWHHKSDELVRILTSLDPKNFMVAGHERIFDSRDPVVLPISTVTNEGRYDDERHGAKSFYKTKGRIFSRVVAVAAKSPAVDVYRIAFLASGARLYGEG